MTVNPWVLPAEPQYHQLGSVGATSACDPSRRTEQVHTAQHLVAWPVQLGGMKPRFSLRLHRRSLAGIMKQPFKGQVEQALNECPLLAMGNPGSQKRRNSKKHIALKKQRLHNSFLQWENGAVSSFYLALTHCNLPCALVKDHGNWYISVIFLWTGIFWYRKKPQLVLSESAVNSCRKHLFFSI